MKTEKDKIFYDGKCHLCATEVKIYKKQDAESNFDFVDISEPGFEPEKEGLDPNKVQKKFHVRKASGELVEGVAAFQAIWEKLPQWKLLHRLSQRSAINRVMRIAYRGFAEIRPFLPKRKTSLKL